MDYYESIKLHHCFVYHAKDSFYISLWNGVLRDGRIDDIDIQFFQAKQPIISNGILYFDNLSFLLSVKQLLFMSDFFGTS